MQTTVTARRCALPPTLRERAHALLARLARLTPRPLEGAAVFETAGRQQVAEVRLRDGRGDAFVARAEAADHRSALDRAAGRLRRQVARAAGRRRRDRVAPAAT